MDDAREDELSEVERDAVNILMFEALGRHREANAAKLRWARTKDDNGEHLARLLTMWLRTTDQLVHLDPDVIEADYRLAQMELARDIDSDHLRCALWCMKVTRNILVTRDVSEFIDCIMMLNEAPSAGRWIETLLGSLAELCGEAIAARERSRSMKARLN